MVSLKIGQMNKIKKLDEFNLSPSTTDKGDGRGSGKEKKLGPEVTRHEKDSEEKI